MQRCEKWKHTRKMSKIQTQLKILKIDEQIWKKIRKNKNVLKTMKNRKSETLKNKKIEKMKKCKNIKNKFEHNNWKHEKNHKKTKTP